MLIRPAALALPVILLLSATACSDSPLTLYEDDALPEPQEARVSIFLTDAPGAVESVWADIEMLTIEGEPGKIDLLSEPTGLIEITELINGELEELVNGSSLPPGKYTKLRAVVGDAILVAEDGKVYVKGNPDLESVLDPTEIPEELGDLHCPSCSSSGFKVILPGGQIVLEEGVSAIVLDFEIGQSFGHAAGKSGKWIMKPVIHATKVDDRDDDGDIDDDLEDGAEIAGEVVLADAVLLIPCGAGETSLEDFIPTATAQNLEDTPGEKIVRSGTVDDNGKFEIGPLAPDFYDLGYVAENDLGDALLQWTASVDPTSVEVTDGKVTGVVYTINSVVCVPNGGP